MTSNPINWIYILERLLADTNADSKRREKGQRQKSEVNWIMKLQPDPVYCKSGSKISKSSVKQTSQHMSEQK